MCGLFSLGVAGFRGLTDAEELAYGRDRLRRWKLLRLCKVAKRVFQKSELAALRQRTFEKQRHLPEPK